MINCTRTEDVWLWSGDRRSLFRRSSRMVADAGVDPLKIRLARATSLIMPTFPNIPPAHPSGVPPSIRAYRVPNKSGRCARATPASIWGQRVISLSSTSGHAGNQHSRPAQLVFDYTLCGACHSFTLHVRVHRHHSTRIPWHNGVGRVFESERRRALRLFEQQAQVAALCAGRPRDGDGCE